MKLKIVGLIMLIAIGLNSVTAKINKTEVPQAVLEAFNKKYPKATDVEWEKDDLNYEVEFELEKVEYEATFSEDGTWLETETEITAKDLPEKVASAFKATYPKVKIKGVEKVETPKISFYEIEYKKGLKKREAFFDKDGNPLESDDE
ncbi:MAG: PepSY-like domain-containing protein [bacterium]